MPRRCLERCGLSEALAACVRYFYLGAGDWADALVCGLLSGGVPPGLAPEQQQHALDRLLEAAVQAGNLSNPNQTLGLQAVDLIHLADRAVLLIIHRIPNYLFALT